MKQSVEEVFNNNNITTVKFYYHKTPLANNIFTVCLLANETQIMARGISICSLKDTYNKTKGRNKAFGRALHAVIHHKNDWKIKSESREDEFMIKTFKCRTEEQKDNFTNNISQELLTVNPNLPITIQEHKKYIEYSFQLSLNYPMILTHKLFKYKSSYKPNPVTKEEIDLFK